MNIALITAGGTGTRMNNNIPKQFLNIEDKPLIIYTLEKFFHVFMVNCKSKFYLEKVTSNYREKAI